MICDAHIHFFSPGFFDGLGAQMGLPPEGRTAAVVARAEWQHPESVEALADRWIVELDKHAVARAALIASLPGDEMSVAAAVARHPSRFVGFFMLNPGVADAIARARQALDAGLLVSFSGILTFKRDGGLRDVARALPLDRLLIETDAPLLAPEGHRGRRNEPAWVVGVGEVLAAARGVPVEDVAAATRANARRLFRLPA